MKHHPPYYVAYFDNAENAPLDIYAPADSFQEAVDAAFHELQHPMVRQFLGVDPLLVYGSDYSLVAKIFCDGRIIETTE